jgi:hypothetical protein
MVWGIAGEHVKDTDHDGVGYRHHGLGVAKAEMLAKWSYVSNCQGLGVSHT